MNTAEYLLKRLEELGITDYFGVPGKYNTNFINTIENAEGLNWIDCTNELNAGYAADGYARQKGFGAFVTSYGTGELKAIGALAGSFAENVPVIHITITPSDESQDRKIFALHNSKKTDNSLFTEANKLVIKTAAFLNKDNAKIETDRVLKTFIKERKPVYIAIPENIALLKISDKITDYDWLSNPDKLNAAAELIINKIKDSNKPVIIADMLAKRFDSKNILAEFINKSGIPVTNLPSGIGIVNMDTENYLGTYIADDENSEARKYINESDCIISVGTQEENPYSLESVFPCDINPNISIYGTYTDVCGEIFDDIKMFDLLQILADKAVKKNLSLEKNTEECVKEPDSKDKLTAGYIYPRLQEFLKGEDIVFADRGTVTYGLAPIKFPENCEYNSQSVSDSAGWACPAAFGAAIANPKARVILITGDGAYQASGMEIGSMCRYGVKPVIIIINNGGYSAGRVLSGNGESDFNNIVQMDYAKLARAFKGDIWATKVETTDDFDKALRVTQIMDKLCVIEAQTDKNDLPELAKKPIRKAPQQKPKKETSNTKPDKKQKKEDKLTISDNGKYETSVHVSLKDFEI